MAFRYREHLILPVTYRDSVMNDWLASAHIEFTENVTVHTVVIKCSDTFQTEQEAERYIIQRAKRWVDEKLLGASGAPSRIPPRKTPTAQAPR